MGRGINTRMLLVTSPIQHVWRPCDKEALEEMEEGDYVSVGREKVKIFKYANAQVVKTTHE